MNELVGLLFIVKLMTWEISAVNNIDVESLQQDIVQVEVDTRAYRQKKSGRGL